MCIRDRQQTQRQQKSPGGTRAHAPRGAHRGGAAGRHHQAHHAVDDEEGGQTKAQQTKQVRRHHGFGLRHSSLRRSLIFFCNSSSRASSCRPTASTRQEISRSREGSATERNPATKSPARLCSHSVRFRVGEYRKARSNLRRASRPFLNSRSSVVITVV